MLCISMKILPRAGAKTKTETVKGFNFCTFIGRDIMAVKGLTLSLPTIVRFLFTAAFFQEHAVSKKI